MLSNGSKSKIIFWCGMKWSAIFLFSSSEKLSDPSNPRNIIESFGT